ncbi:MAG: A/G-specific adenine glycosylase [Bacteroidota bacterium]|nr:A/G-specific adenine glycosylase [Bacteroidota bacterium]
MIKFTTQLVNWYRINARDLPWRNTRNPYHIWVSEIIFQQTRIDQGFNYYLRFIDRFPAVDQLANAEEQDVLRIWQGLGYYSRARNLHAAAKQVVHELGGVFPNTYDQIIRLKGVGSYTAAAVASIAFGERKVVVDGNVLRFISRYGGITDPIDTKQGKELVENLAFSLSEGAEPGVFNQALMEFGALYCVPRNPDCPNCIFKTGCKAFAMNATKEIPLKSKRITVRKRFFNYLFLYRVDQNNQTEYLMQRRGRGDIWQGLYEFPMIESNSLLSPDSLTATLLWQQDILPHQPVLSSRHLDFVHQLTHQQLHTRFFIVRLHEMAADKIRAEWIRVPEASMHQYPVSRLIHKFLNSLQDK